MEFILIKIPIINILYKFAVYLYGKIKPSSYDYYYGSFSQTNHMRIAYLNPLDKVRPLKDTKEIKLKTHITVQTIIENDLPIQKYEYGINQKTLDMQNLYKQNKKEFDRLFSVGNKILFYATLLKEKGSYATVEYCIIEKKERK